MKKKSLFLLGLFLATFISFSIPEKAQAMSPSAFGWTLGERIYGYPQWKYYYRWRVIELGKWPIAHRYNAFLSIGPYQRYEIQVTPFGRVSVISGISNFGSSKACKTAQLALSPQIASLAAVNKIGFLGPGYNVTSSCTAIGTLAYQVAYFM